MRARLTLAWPPAAGTLLFRKRLGRSRQFDLGGGFTVAGLDQQSIRGHHSDLHQHRFIARSMVLRKPVDVLCQPRFRPQTVYALPSVPVVLNMERIMPISFLMRLGLI